jgi:hypothetical protein
MNENLTKLAQKIDFTKTGPDDLNGEVLEVDKNEDEKDPNKTQQSTLWPWDSVRNKLRFVTLFPQNSGETKNNFSEMRSLKSACWPTYCQWPRSDTTWY